MESKTETKYGTENEELIVASSYKAGRFKDLLIKSTTFSSCKATRCSTLGIIFSEGHGINRSYTGYLKRQIRDNYLLLSN
jgi:hypothetical protein